MWLLFWILPTKIRRPGQSNYDLSIYIRSFIQASLSDRQHSKALAQSCTLWNHHESLNILGTSLASIFILLISPANSDWEAMSEVDLVGKG